MATATLSGVPSTISTAESITGWTGDTFSLDPDIKVQGSNSVSCAMTNNGSNDIYYTGFTAANLNAVHLRMFFNISFVGNLSATTPVQVYISDGTNTAYWNIDVTGYAGGWRQAVVYTGNTPTSGTRPTGNSTRVGMLFTTSTKPRNVPANAWFDAWYYGDGYTVYGGTSGDAIDWSHIASVDNTNAYGIVEEINGVYFLGGDIKIGDGTNTTYFEPSGQIAVFKDLPVNSTLYNIEFVDSASGLTNIAISGGAWSADGTQNFTIDASDTNLNAFSIDGVQVSNSGAVTFFSGATVSNMVFDDCGQVDPSTASFTNVTFANYVGTTGALLFPSDDSNISSLQFINCDNGVEYGSGSDSTSPSFNDFTFDDVSGNYDVNNTSGSAVTISKNNGSNPNSYNPSGSTVTFAGASVTTQVTVYDLSTGGELQNARVFLEVKNGTNFPYLDSVTITGSATTEDSYSETNVDSYSSMTTTQYKAQAFQATNSKKLTACAWYGRAFGSPTGNVTAYLYALTGTPNSNATPTGSPLATSNPIDASTISGTAGLLNFVFDNQEQYTLTASTWYCIVIQHAGDASNYIEVGLDGSSSSHGGNLAISSDGSAWTPVGGQDFSFYTYSDGTATVSHTAHGLSTGDYVTIRGANQDVYNGQYQITVTGVNGYTYVTNEAPLITPATGTITSTFVVISGLTNASGIISDTRQIPSNQLVGGWVRKSDSSPYFQEGSITGTISSTLGLSINVQLPRDE